MNEATYDEVLGELMLAREELDNSQWVIGDGAIRIFGDNLPKRGKKGEKSLISLAGDLGVGIRSMQDWYKLASFYPKPTRNLFENLSYTHYRVARRYAGDIEQAMELLEYACQEGQSVAGFERHLKEVIGKPRPKPDDMIRLPRLFLGRAIEMLEGKIALEKPFIEQLKEYLQ
jgi:hypothetical protein